MRRHDNQITPFVFGSGNDAFSRILILYINAIAGHSVCGPASSSIIKNAISRRSRYALEATDRIRLTLPRLVSHVQGRPWLGHRDDGGLCIVSLGEGKPMFEGLRRQLRAVGCYQDMPVHRWTSSVVSGPK
jgi:hypothetical protein